MKLLSAIAGSLVAIAAAMPALGDTYPSQMIHLVVPYPAGGATDILARQVAAKLGPLLGQTVIVENRSGASGRHRLRLRRAGRARRLHFADGNGQHGDQRGVRQSTV